MLIEKSKNRTAKIIVGLIFSILACFFVVLNSDYMQFLDSTVIQLVQKNVTGFLNGFYTFITSIASPKFDIFWILVTSFFLWGFKYKIPALWALFTLGFGDIIGFVIKNAVKRTRPLAHLISDDGYSFPSGHVLGIVLVCGILWVMVLPLIKNHLINILLKIILVIFVCLVMLSRIYLNAHFPSDTLGALIIGYTWLQISESLYPIISPKLAKLRIVRNTKY